MDVLTRLRNPAYTGDQRCLPCTVVNVVLVALAAAVLGVVGRPLVAGAVLVGGLVAVALRGYVVPFTPRFAPPLVRALPVPDGWFHETQADGDGTREGGSLSDESDVDGEAVLGRLVETGVIREEGERIVLDETFERLWRGGMEKLRSDSELIDAVESFPGIGSAEFVNSDGGKWLAIEGQTNLVPRPVAVAEAAAVWAMPDELRDDVALAAARSLRQFLEDCPVCETPLESSTEVSCCGGHVNPTQKPRDTLVCPECEQRLVTIPRAAGDDD